MYTPSNKISSHGLPGILVVVLFLMISSFCKESQAQTSPININIAVLPPYTSAIYEYIDNPEKVIVNISHMGIGMGPLEIYLQGSIISDGGISAITEPGYKPPNPIIVNEGSLYTLSPDNISTAFDLDHVIIEGIDIADLITIGLPEDNYQICLQAYDYYTDEPLSAESPMGCSNIFFIRNLEPPMVIMPICGDTIGDQMQGNVLVSWSRPAGAPPSTTFTLYMVEIPSYIKLMPQEIINTNMFPPFYEEQTLSTMLFLSPEQLNLRAGYKYAFVVQADDPTQFVTFMNDGLSEVCHFIYEEPFESPWINNGFELINPDTFALPPILSPTFVSGNLNYKYDPQYSASQDHFPLSNTRISIVPVYILKNATISSSTQGSSSYDEFVIRNYGELFRETVPMNSSEHSLADNFNTLATTTTGPDGFFSLVFSDTINCGLIMENFQATQTIPFDDLYDTHEYGNPLSGFVNPIINWGLEGITELTGVSFINTHIAGNNMPGGNQTGGTQLMSGHVGNFTKSYTGDLYRYYRIVVENQYYCCPNYNIDADPGSSVNIGEQDCLVQYYDLQLHIKADSTIQEQAGPQGEGLDGVQCFILRSQSPPTGLPEHEGMETNGLQAVGIRMYDKISEDESGFDGTVIFHNLVRHDVNNDLDKMVLYARTPIREGSYVYQPKSHTYPVFPQYSEKIPYNYPITWGVYMGTYYGYIFNNEFEKITYDASIYLSPANPRVAGRVMYKSVPIAGATCFTSYNADGEDISDIDGLFAFNNLEVIGYGRKLIVTKHGFEDYESIIGTLIAGNQRWLDIELIPWGLIKGYVTNKSGTAIEAYIQVDTLDMNATERRFSFFPTKAREQFLFRAPSGQRRVRIFPVSTQYLPLDTTLIIQKNIDPDDPQLLGTFVLQENKHRIRTHLAYIPKPGNGMFTPPPVNVQMAQVTLNGITKYTNASGIAEFEFSSPETQFEVNIIPPTGSNYAVKQVTIYNNPTEEFQTTHIQMVPGFSLQGIVTAGTDNHFVSGARVFVDAPGYNSLEAFTNAQGRYTLNGIPEFSTPTIVVRATAQSPHTTYVGDKKTIAPESQDVNFHLTVYEDMDITKLWELPIEIESIYYEGRKIFLNGAFVNLPPVTGIKTANISQRIPFSGVQIIPSTVLNSSGKPLAKPLNEEVRCTITEFPLTIFDNYKAKQLSNHPVMGSFSFLEKLIRIRKNDKGKGFLLGRVYLEKSSFHHSAEHFDVDDEKNLNLCKSSEAFPYIVSFKAPEGNQGFTINSFYVVQKNGEDPKFLLNGFEAQATNGSAMLRTSGLLMDIKFSPTYPLVDFSEALEATNFSIGQNSISNINSTAPFTVGLENWTVSCPNGWQMASSESRILIPDVIVNTGLVSISAGAMHLLPDRMDFQDIQYNNMTLANVVPLVVEPGAESVFYLDKNANPDGKMHYVMKLTGVQPSGVAASFSGLEGLPQGTKIRIPTMQILSNDKLILSGFETLNEPLTFHNNLVLRLQMIAAKEDYLKLTGLFDLKIPGLSNSMTADLKFQNDGAGNAALMPLSLNVRLNGKGNVLFIADRVNAAQELNAEFYRASGKLEITDKGAMKVLTGTLYSHKRPGGETYIKVDEDYLALGGANDPVLRIDTSDMRVVNSQWDYLWFEGPMEGTPGLSQNGTTQTTKFVVGGAINADNTAVSVDGIDTPFGGLTITYSIPRSEFIGQLVVPEYNFEAAAFGGVLSARFGSLGWYFMGCGTGKLPVIGGVKKMAILLGDYDDTSVFLEDLKKYTIRNKFPIGNSFSGIFISAGKNDLFGLNLPSFNWHETIPVIDKEIGISLNWDALVGVDMTMDFTNLDRFIIGTRGYISGELVVNACFAYAKGGLYVDILGEGVTELSPPYMSFYQCWGAGVSGEIGGSMLGVSGSFGFSKTLHAKLFIDQHGFGNIDNITIDVGEGGCDAKPQ